MSGDSHGHGHGSRFIQHHYDDAKHQFDSGKLAIWLFLAQEVLFFSALFVAYVLYRNHHPEIYSYAHKYLDVKYGAINTAVLIFSSLTAAWAVRAAQLGQRKLLIGCLAVTVACAGTFLGIKYIEYSHKYHEQILFGRYFDPCVSSGGVELLTKKNECAGSKTTVDYDLVGGTAKSGCFGVSELDRDRDKPGIQAECKVDEVHYEFYTPPTLKQSGNHDCNKTPIANIIGSGGQYTITGACEGLIVKGDKNTLTIDSVKHLQVQGTENHIKVKAADAVEAGMPAAAPAAAKDGDKPAPAPTPAAPVAPAKNDITVDAAVTPDKKPVIGAIDSEVQPDNSEHPKEVKRVQIKDECPEESPLEELEHVEHANVDSKNPQKKSEKKHPCWRTAFQPAVCKADKSGDKVGILVEYGDHEERGREIGISANCTKPDKAADPGDVLADKDQKLLFGAAAIKPGHVLTAHEEHELEAAGPPPEHTNMFFTIYFAMTGLHGVHVIFGIGVFIWLLIRAIRGHFTPDYFGPVDYAALYWHIVDLIWIFLFPLLYLIH